MNPDDSNSDVSAADVAGDDAVKDEITPGYANYVLGVVLLLDSAVLLFSRRRLVCYRCRTSFHGLPIARYHRPWDRATADRHPLPPGHERRGSFVPRPIVRAAAGGWRPHRRRPTARESTA